MLFFIWIFFLHFKRLAHFDSLHIVRNVTFFFFYHPSWFSYLYLISEKMFASSTLKTIWQVLLHLSKAPHCPSDLYRYFKSKYKRYLQRCTGTKEISSRTNNWGNLSDWISIYIYTFYKILQVSIQNNVQKGTFCWQNKEVTFTNEPWLPFLFKINLVGVNFPKVRQIETKSCLL